MELSGRAPTKSEHLGYKGVCKEKNSIVTYHLTLIDEAAQVRGQNICCDLSCDPLGESVRMSNYMLLFFLLKS